MKSIEPNTNLNQVSQQNHDQDHAQNENSNVNIPVDEYSNNEANEAFISEMDEKIDKDYFENSPIQSTNNETGIEEIINKSPKIIPKFENEDERLSSGEFKDFNLQTNQSNQNNNMENNEERMDEDSNNKSTHV